MNNKTEEAPEKDRKREGDRYRPTERDRVRESEILAFAFVSMDPSPQNVPPPIDVPPILSNEVSDSTYSNTTMSININSQQWTLLPSG